MKTVKSFLVLCLVVAGSVVSIAAVNHSNTVETIAPKAKICFKIKNDTGKSQTLHTGSGTKIINNLTSSEVCIEEGGKLYMADSGNKGKVLLEVKAGISGKTFELSKLM